MDINSVIEFTFDKFADIHNFFSEYFSLLSKKTDFQGFNPEEFDFIQTSLKSLNSVINEKKFAEEIKAAISEINLEEIIKKIKKINQIIFNLKKIKTIFDEHELSSSQIGSEISSNVYLSVGFLEDSDALKRKIDFKIENFNNSVKINDANKIISEILVKQISDCENEKVMDILYSVKKIFITSVKKNESFLLIDFIRNLLDYIFTAFENRPGVKKLSSILNDIVEELKTNLIITPEIIESRKNFKNKNNNLIQKLIQRYYLIARGESSDLKTLIEENLNIKINSSEILKTAAKLLSSSVVKYGFIIFYKASSFQHDIRGIIDKQYLFDNNLKYSSMEGINEKIIKRTSTLRESDYTETKTLIQVENSCFIENANNRYYIIECLNSSQYYFLHPFEKNQKSYSVPQFWIRDINSDKTSPSLKVESYNAIIETQILQSVSYPLTENKILDFNSIKMEESYWNGFRAKLKNYIMPDFKEILLKKKLTEAHFKATITNEKIIDKIILEIAEIAKSDLGRNKSLEFNSEIALSYFNEMKFLVEKFPKKMLDVYSEHADSLKKVLNNSARVIEILNKILDSVLKYFINYKSGIFFTIKNKIDILKNSSI